MYATRNTTEKTPSRNPLPWILIGAVLAPLVMFLMSWLSHDPSLRSLQVLLIVPLTGAVAGWGVYAFNPAGKPRGFRKSIWLVVTVLVYIMAVLFGYALSQVGSIS